MVRELIAPKTSSILRKPGRKGVPKSIKKLVLEMKNENLLRGCRRISDELKKLGVNLHHTTVNKIIQTFRKERKVRITGSWVSFWKAHWDTGFHFATLDFSMYDIKAIANSVAAPNMNAFTERLIGSIGREALDHFLLFSERQIRTIIAEYVPYRRISCTPASLATLLTSSRVREQITMSAPSSAKQWAIPVPIPRPAPVTIATLPSIFITLEIYFARPL